MRSADFHKGLKSLPKTRLGVIALNVDHVGCSTDRCHPCRQDLKPFAWDVPKAAPTRELPTGQAFLDLLKALW